ncbi:MAG: hypothetical protein U9O49_02945 [Candidatus Thermoplasmatota archaeon]|nr:hypothetical protein [Candidatus Thermoplasmatota archaeon]
MIHIIPPIASNPRVCHFFTGYSIGTFMAKPTTMNITPIIIDMMALILGPPGAFMNRAILGFKKAPIPNNKGNIPPKMMRE